MSEAPLPSDALVRRIEEKRAELMRYVARAEPRSLLLVNCSIIAGALAAALTAGPGIAGTGFIDFAKNHVSLGFPVWQALCLAATAFSLLVVVANGMLRSHDFAAKIARARACQAHLEGLALNLELGQVDVKQATQTYERCLLEIASI